MNCRRVTNFFSVDDIKELEAAEGHARRIGCRFNCLLTLAPFRDCDGVPTPETRMEAWERLHSHLSMWAKRRGFAFTALWAWHADEDGSNPHVHVFAHLPTSRRRYDLQAALLNVYPDPGVIDVREANDFVRRHSDKGYGSVLGYLTRFRSQQAFMRSRWKGGVTTARSSPR